MRTGLSDTILKGTIPARFGRGEDLNAIFYQNMPNLHNRYISAERKISQKNMDSGHLEWRAGLSDTILKGTHPGTIPARFGLIWFSGFRGEDLNAIFYQNMPNLHNRYISAERKISQKNMEYMLNYSLPCSCS